MSTKNIDYKKLKDEKRISEGIGEVYGQLFEACGFSDILKGEQAKRNSFHWYFRSTLCSSFKLHAGCRKRGDVTTTRKPTDIE